MIDYLEIAQQALEHWQNPAVPNTQSATAGPTNGRPAADKEPLEDALRGCAIELWSTAAGRLFLVADEGDARTASERFGARRGEIYTAAEARRIVAVNDPSAVAEIHAWKRRFDAMISDENR